MDVNRVGIFLLLVILCVAASSLNMSRSTARQYAEYEKMAQAGDLVAAEYGYRRLAMKYPYTPAGIRAARSLVKDGASPARLVLDILKAGIRNTSAAEWLVLISAFFVITVVMGSKLLPDIVLILFILSAAGMFHLSHPMVSVNSTAFDAFLAANPYIYLALTVLIVGTYLYRRWEIAGQMVYQQAIVRGNLPLGEQVLVKEIYSEKLKALQEDVRAIEGGLQTPHGLHFVKEVNRVSEAVEKERQLKQKEMDAAEARHQEAIRATQEDIERTQKELLENRILYKSTAIDRREYKRNRLQMESSLGKSRQRLAETRATLESLKKISRENRLHFKRRDLFLAYLHGAFVDRQDGLEDLSLRDALFHPKIADAHIKKRKIIYRKSSAVGEKLVKLEQRRSKLKDSVYNARLTPLMTEKQVIDNALVAHAGKISEHLESCRNEIERLESIVQALTAELADMQALQKIRNCFPAHVKARIRTIRQGLRYCRNILPVLQKSEKIYSATLA